MKFLSLLSVASAVLVTETRMQTYYVTVNANGDAIDAPATTSSTSELSSSTAEATTTSHPLNAMNYVNVSPAPATTESSSTTTSSSSTYVAPTTTSSSVEVTTSSTSAAPAATSLSSFASDIVNYHNRVRAQHQVGDLTWNSDLANYAQNYLNNQNCVFAHSGGPYGENIAIGFDTTDHALDAWYNEEDLYNYSTGLFSEATGHFTQMVWKGTSEVGCATVDCSGSTFLACEYTARGNIIGEFTENVFAKTS